MPWKRGENLGSGRFGVVFACRDSDSTDDEWPYAVKRLQTDWTAVEEAVTRFKREVDIQAELDHPNVMPVVAAGENSRGPWFVMPRADGGSLKDALGDGRANDQGWVLAKFGAVLPGVAHAHERGVLHRDLKPSNIMLIEDEPLISDFGVARQLDVDGTTLTRTAQELGTLRYMAPEQFKDAKRAGPPADVYSLGKILCHLLTGRTPEVLKVQLDGVPREYRFFVDKCCREDPERRYQTAGEALAAFRQIGTPIKVLLPPAERAQQLAEEAHAVLDTEDEAGAIEALETHLRDHSDDSEMFKRVVPRIPKAVARAWAMRLPDGLRETLKIYDQIIEDSNLAFSYCDVVADFYIVVFKATEDMELQRMILARLLVMGHHYNRFYVHAAVVDLLPTIDDPSEVALVEEAIDEHDRAAAWYAENALKKPLQEPIAAALRRTLEP